MAPPGVVAPIVPRPQQVLPPPIVGHLIEDPAALQHTEGADLTQVEGVLDARAVLAQLHHEAFVFFLLTQLQAVGACLLGPQREGAEEATTQQMNLVGWGMGVSM